MSISFASATQALDNADPNAALTLLQAEVRARPNDAKLRVFLFQLLCVLGQWERALAQLNVAAQLDPNALAMAQMYRDALQCEVLRAEVFQGKRSPIVFGEPEPWLALLIEALSVPAAQAQALRAQAFDQAPESPCTIDGRRVAWLADADMRLGPVCEAIINGRYYWIAFTRLAEISIEAPSDLRDVVWMPAHFRFTNGGDAVGVIPTRYPGSELSEDGHIRLARKTSWEEVSPGCFHGLGQRSYTDGENDYPLMDVRVIAFDAAAGNG